MNAFSINLVIRGVHLCRYLYYIVYNRQLNARIALFQHLSSQVLGINF